MIKLSINKLGVNLIQFFVVNLLTLYGKLDLFIAMQQILLMLIKRSSLQKRVSKFTPKKFYEIDPRSYREKQVFCYSCSQKVVKWNSGL